jgi:hypothetical protein
MCGDLEGQSTRITISIFFTTFLAAKIIMKNEMAGGERALSMGERGESARCRNGDLVI